LNFNFSPTWQLWAKSLNPLSCGPPPQPQQSVFFTEPGTTNPNQMASPNQFVFNRLKLINAPEFYFTLHIPLSLLLEPIPLFCYTLLFCCKFILCFSFLAFCFSVLCAFYFYLYFVYFLCFLYFAQRLNFNARSFVACIKIVNLRLCQK